jgi:Ca2+-binding RTX toxin-like protein
MSMPEAPPYTVPMQQTVTSARNGVLTTAVNATESTDLKGLKDVYDAATKAEKFGNKINEMDGRPDDDLVQALRDLRPAGDLADLLGNVPILGKGALGVPGLVDVLNNLQDMIDRASDWADRHNPWNDPPSPPPPPPPPPSPGPGGPWSPGGPDPFFDPPKDPLVLDLDGGGIDLIAVDASTADFDMDGDGFTERTGWVGPGEGFLVLDANANGIVDGIAELFGDAVTDGFDELAAYDSNHDGLINASDAVFSSLKLWVDANGNGVTDAGELQTLSYHGVTSISLNYAEVGLIQDGNLVARTSSFGGVGGVGDASTIWFATNQLVTEYVLPPNFVFDPDALLLPELQGFGDVADLRVAMTQNSDLLGMVRALVVDAAGLDASTFRERLGDVLAEWAQIGTVADGSRGPHVDAEELAILEAFYGVPFTGVMTARWGQALDGLFDQFVDFMGLRFIPQIPLSDLLLHENSAEDALTNPFWAFAGAYDEDTGEYAFDLGAIVERMSFELRMHHGDEPMAFVAQMAPWLGALKGELYMGDTAAFGAALKYYLLQNGHDNAITMAFYEAAMGAQVVAGPGGPQAGDGDDLIFAADGAISAGGFGDDSYAVERGVHATIVETSPTVFADSADDAVLIRGHYAREAAFSVVGGQLLISFPDDPSSSIVVSLRAGHGAVERFVFQDRTLSLSDVMARTLTDGTGQADILRGTAGADELDGGGGNDELIGGAGDDTYLFGLGSGGDVVVETADGGFDTIQLGAGITDTDIVFERAGGDLLVRIAGTADVLTVRGWFAGATVETIVFDDDTILYPSDVSARLTAGTGATLTGTSGADTLESGAGHDRLVGGNGGDTYIYEVGDGYDVIADGASLSNNASTTDTLVLQGLSLADVQFGRIGAAYGNHLVIDILGNVPGRIVIEKGLNIGDSVSGQIERFVFEDVVLTYADVVALLRANAQTDGDDVILGWDVAGVYEGGRGNDEIHGFGATDTYVWSAGDGRDIIYNASGGTLELRGVNPDEVVVRRSATGSGDMELAIGGSGAQAVVIHGQAEGRMAIVRFDDGTVWDQAELVLRLEGLASSVVTHAGTGGADNLNGTNGDDVVEGHAGNDTLAGGYGSDHYIYRSGDGNDLIAEFGAGAFADVDVLTLVDLAPSDIRASRVGYDLVLQDLATNATVTVRDHFLQTTHGLERIYFAGGEVWDLAEIALNAPIRGSAGADSLNGGGSSSGVYYGDHQVFEGGGGADALAGGRGSDIYLWRLGDGDDVITETAFTNDRTSRDELRLIDVDPSDVELTWRGLDLEIHILSSDERLTVSYQLWALDSGPNSFGYGIESLRFADGTTWSREDIAARAVLRGSDDDDYLWGTEEADVIQGGLGDDEMSGDAGSDTYLYADGDGSDIIIEQGGTSSDVDTLDLGSLSLSDVTFEIAGNHLLIHTPSGGTITIWGQLEPDLYGGSSGQGLERIILADATLEGRSAILSAALSADFDSAVIGTASDDTLTVNGGRGFLSGADGDDVLTGASAADWIMGGAGHDVLEGRGGRDLLEGGAGDDLLSGGAQADSLEGGAGDDTLDGGAGDDMLDGGEGSDTYLIAPGGGADTIRDYGDPEDIDVVQLSAGVTPADVTLSRSGSDLILHVAGPAGVTEVRIEQQFGSGGVEEVRFADTTVWSRSAIEAAVLSASQTAGDDTILGYDGDDVLEGGAGQDYLEGGQGNDTYLFDAGDGHDWIEEHGGVADRLLLGPGLSANGMTLERLGEDGVRLNFAGGESVSLARQLLWLSSGVEYGIEEIVFSDLTVLTKDDLADMLVAASATAGDDQIRGFDRDEALAGGAGRDVFVFDSAAFGNDVITDFSASEDRIEFAEWMYASFSDLQGLMSQDGTDVLIDTDYGQVRIEGVTLGDLTAGNFKFGLLGDDTLTGGAGDDFLEGGAGDDTYVINAGGGSDVIFDSEGDADTLLLGPGLTIAGMSISRIEDGYDSVELIFSGGERILLDSQLAGLGLGWSDGVEQIVFADSTVLTKGDLADLILQRAVTAGDDRIKGFDRDDTLTGGAGSDLFVFETEAFGNDVVTDFGATDRIEFADWMFQDFSGVLAASVQQGDAVVITTNYGAVTLLNTQLSSLTESHFKFGMLGDDTLSGTAEDEDLDGGAGNDTYLIAAGGGEDWIYDEFGTADQIIFGTGLDHSTMTVERLDDGADGLWLVFSSGERIALYGQMMDYGQGGEVGVEQLVFADSTILTRSDLAARLLGSESTSGADIIRGLSSDDFLLGGSGADVFVFGESAFGADVIGDFNGLEDRISFDEDVLQDFEAVLFASVQDGSDVLISSGSGSVRLVDTALSDLSSDMFIFS